MNKKMLVTSILITILVFVGIFYKNHSLPAAENSQEKNQKKSSKVRVAPVIETTITSTLSLTGSVESLRTAQLASPAEGPVSKINVHEADLVKKGDILMAIGRTKSADALVLSLQEEVKKEEDNTQRTRKLVEDEAIPGEQLDQARINLEKIRAQLVKAREMVLDYTVAAPWNGVVSRLLVKDGAFVAPRVALLEMYDPNSLVIRSAVPEKYSTKIKMDMPVVVTLDAYPKETYHGKIDRAYPYLDPRLRTRTLEISLKEPVELLPGMFARITIETDTIPNALVIPASALIPAQSGKRAVFLVAKGKAVKRLVKTGIEEGNRVRIISGIEARDRVVIAGNENLKDGDTIRVIKGKKQQEGRK